jgi:hypothetical protein
MMAAPRLAGAGSFGPYWPRHSAASREERPETAVETVEDCSPIIVGRGTHERVAGTPFQMSKVVKTAPNLP